jgi:hypothetical protein
MMDQPHWLVQELTGEAVWTALALSAALAWKNREAIAQRLRRPRDIPRTVTDRLGLTDTVTLTGGGTLTAGTQAQILYDVRALAGTERQILYNVEAAKPSLARRLEDLAAWYLHVS